MPSQVSHACYWQRYFYKVHKWQLEQERKAELVRRAETCNEQKDLGWDEGLYCYFLQIVSTIVLRIVFDRQSIYKSWLSYLAEDDWGDMAAPSSPPKFSTTPLIPVGTVTPVPELAQRPAQPPATQECDIKKEQPNTTDIDTVLTNMENVDLKDDQSKIPEAPAPETTQVQVTLLREDFVDTKLMVDKADCDQSAPDVDAVPVQTESAVVSPTDTSSSVSTGVSESSSGVDESSLDTLTVVSPVSPENTPDDAESKAFPKSTTANKPASEEAAELPVEIKTREKGDLVVVGSSSDRTTPSSDSTNSNNKGEAWQTNIPFEHTV